MKFVRELTVLVALVFLAAGHEVLAADGTWNVDTNGNWGDAGNWTSNVVASGSDFTATLGNVITADRTITNESARTIGNITASDTSNNYTISGTNTLTLERTDATAPTINVTSGRTLFISSVIAGNDGLQKTGAGSLELNASSTFTGNADIAAGTIRMTTATSDTTLFGASGNTITFTGNGTIQTVADGAYDLPQNITINNGVTGTILGAFGESVTAAGVISGTGSLTIQGNSNGFGTTLSNTANTFTGAISINPNSTTTLNVASLGSSANVITLGGGGNNPVFNYTGSAALSRTFAIATTTGGVNINSTGSGALTASGFSVTGAGAKTITIGGASTASNTIAGNIANNGGATSVTKAGAGKWTISGNMSNTGALTISGGSLTLAGTNTYSGQTKFNAAGTTLILAGTNAVSPSTSFLMNANASTSDSTAKLLDDTGGVNDSTVAVPNTFTIQNNNTPGNAHTFIVGNNNTANGGTSAGTTTGSTIAIGTLNWNTYATGTTAYGPIQIQGSNGYRLQFDSVVLHNAANLSSGTVGNTYFTPTSANATLGTVTVGTGNTGQGYQTLVLDGTSSDNRVTGAISDASDVGASGRPLRVTKSNTSTWTLSGANTFSGKTTISGGTLILASGQCLSDTNTLTISGTGKLQLNDGVREKVGSLVLGTTTNTAPATWGSPLSSAANTNSYFTGTGVLYVNLEIPASGSVIVVK